MPQSLRVATMVLAFGLTLYLPSAEASPPETASARRSEHRALGAVLGIVAGALVGYALAPDYGWYSDASPFIGAFAGAPLGAALAWQVDKHTEPPSSGNPAEGRDARGLGVLVGAGLGGLAGLYFGHYQVTQMEKASIEGLHGPEGAFTEIGFTVGGLILGGAVGYAVGMPRPAPPPAAATAWSELRPLPKLTATPRDGRVVVPLLAFSF